jgi:hypothetical protein
MTYDAELGVAGRQLILMIVGNNRWVVRRTDELEFLDYAETSRISTIEIDLTSAPKARTGNWPSWKGCVLVPLLLQERDRHLHADVYGSGGERLPRLARTEIRVIIASGLTDLIAARTPGPVDHHNLYRCVLQALDIEHDRERPLDAAVAQMVELIQPALGGHRPVEHVTKVLELFHRYHVVATALHEPQQRFVIRIERIIQHTLSRSGRIWEASELNVRVDVPEVNESRSYHVFAVAPLDLIFQGERCAIVHQQPDGERQTLERAEAGSSRSLHLSVHQVGRVQDPTLNVRILHVNTGQPRLALWSATLSLLVLALGAIYLCVRTHPRVPGQSDAAVALLLVIPGVIGSILAVPANHSMTSQLRRRTRICVGASAIPVFAAALVVALDWRGSGLQAVWIVGAVIAAVAAVTLYLQRRQMPAPTGSPT